MKKIILYPTVTVIGQDFKNVKVVTVPNQSMSLREIIQRFTRKESLPIEKDGIYVEGLGDLEKMDKADIQEKREAYERVKSNVSKIKKQIEDKEEEKKKRAPGSSPPPSQAASGEPKVDPPAPKGP